MALDGRGVCKSGCKSYKGGVNRDHPVHQGDALSCTTPFLVASREALREFFFGAEDTERDANRGALRTGVADDCKRQPVFKTFAQSVPESDAGGGERDSDEIAREKESAGIWDTLVLLELRFRGSRLSRPKAEGKDASGLWLKRANEVGKLIVRAHRERDIVRRPDNTLRITAVVLFVLLLLAVPVLLWLRYEVTDSDMQYVSNIAQALDAIASFIALVFAALVFIVFLEFRVRARVASDGIFRARKLIQMIDSHVLSNPGVSAVLRNSPAPADEPFTPKDAVEYLLFAGCLVRIAAKTGMLYAQWLPRDFLIREAEDLFQTSLQIERNCLEKVQIIESRG